MVASRVQKVRAGARGMSQRAFSTRLLGHEAMIVIIIMIIIIIIILMARQRTQHTQHPGVRRYSETARLVVNRALVQCPHNVASCMDWASGSKIKGGSCTVV